MHGGVGRGSQQQETAAQVHALLAREILQHARGLARIEARKNHGCDLRLLAGKKSGNAVVFHIVEPHPHALRCRARDLGDDVRDLILADHPRKELLYAIRRADQSIGRIERFVEFIDDLLDDLLGNRRQRRHRMADEADFLIVELLYDDVGRRLAHGEKQGRHLIHSAERRFIVVALYRQRTAHALAVLPIVDRSYAVHMARPTDGRGNKSSCLSATPTLRLTDRRKPPPTLASVHHKQIRGFSDGSEARCV